MRCIILQTNETNLKQFIEQLDEFIIIENAKIWFNMFTKHSHDI